jgi:elongation factor P
MSHNEPLRKGIVIRYEGHLFTVADFHTVQQGKQKPTVHVKLRALQDGRAVERTLDQLGTIEEVASEIRDMQFLYVSGQEHVFMDLTTFEQYPLTNAQVGTAAQYLVEERTYRVLCVDGQPLAVQLPPMIAIEIADTAPPEHAGGGNSVFKEARLASGRTIMVPLFIKTGDKVRVNSETGAYEGKEH